MPGRNDFAIIRSEALGNEKIDAFADALIAEGLADESTALPAALGVVAMLGIWAYRETDDGVMSITEIRRAILSRGRLLNVLRTSQLLREQSDGRYYLVGFEDCYGSYVKARKEARDRMREYRASKKGAGSKNVRRTSPERSTTQDRTGQDTTVLSLSGQEGVAPSPALGRDRAPPRDKPWREVYGDGPGDVIVAAREIGALLKRDPIPADDDAGRVLLAAARRPDAADRLVAVLSDRLDRLSEHDTTLATRAREAARR